MLVCKKRKKGSNCFGGGSIWKAMNVVFNLHIISANIFEKAYIKNNHNITFERELYNLAGFGGESSGGPFLPAEER